MPRVTPSTREAVRETTDDTVRVVVVWGTASYTLYHGSHHGTPACGITSERGKLVEWPVEQARAWRDPCSYCFPDGDRHDDEDENRDTDGVEAGDRQ
jgi:hypothetical protein